jgi:hypothetical protein
MMTIAIVAAALLTLLSQKALAGSDAVTLRGMGGNPGVIVWKNVDAHDEGLTLIRAGVHNSNPKLLLRLIACLVDNGTKAVITSGGLVTQDILVVAGAQAGCRGNVATEETRKN